MREIPRGAVIATHNRPVELRRCVAAIAPQVDQIVIIDNASNPPLGHNEADLVEILSLADPRQCVITMMRDEEQPPNLSRLWNLGIDYIGNLYRKLFKILDQEPRWDVAVLNDDAIPPPDWFDRVAVPMRTLHADAASHGEFIGPEWGEVLYGPSAPMSVTTRLAGWAFILRGEWSGARFDERLRWWCGDDLVSLNARNAGGLLQIGGLRVPNTGADTSTVGALAEQAGRDRAMFVEITGRQPW